MHRPKNRTQGAASNGGAAGSASNENAKLFSKQGMKRMKQHDDEHPELVSKQGNKRVKHTIEGTIKQNRYYCGQVHEGGVVVAQRRGPSVLTSVIFFVPEPENTFLIVEGMRCSWATVRGREKRREDHS